MAAVVAGVKRPVEREHGTPKGYRQHRYHRDVVCKPCLDANYNDSAPRAHARYAALTRLSKLFPREFKALYEQEKKARGI